MTTRNSGDNDRRYFSAGFEEPSGIEDINSDFWSALRLLVSDASQLERMRLIRWEGLQSLLGENWAQKKAELTKTLREEIEARLPADYQGLRYDDVSLLVVGQDVSDQALRVLVGEVAETVTPSLPDASSPVEPIQIWKPVTVEEGGFSFERVDISMETEVGAQVVEESAEPVIGGLGQPSDDLSGQDSSEIILPDPEFKFMPIWDVHSNAVFAYRCQPFWSLESGQVLSEGHFADLFADASRVLAVDVETLRKGTRMIEDALDQYGMAQVVIPVHHATLAEPEFASRYRQYRDELIWPYVESVFFEIVRPAAPISRDQLAKSIEDLGSCSSGIFLSVDPEFHRFDELPVDGVLSIGLDVGADEREPEEVTADLERFASGAGSQNLHSHVLGLQNSEITMSVIFAGFDYIGSDALATAVEGEVPEDAGVEMDSLLKMALAAKSKGL